MVIVEPHLICCLSQMLQELTESKLEVCLVPGTDDNKTDEGRFIRAAVSQNVGWYQELCLMYPSTRKRKKTAPDTKIKRANVIGILNTMIKEGKSVSKYADDLLQLAEDIHKVFEIPWNNQF